MTSNPTSTKASTQTSAQTSSKANNSSTSSSKTTTSIVHHLGGMRFMGETADGQRVMIDNEKVARTGMSPMQLVLNAVGACAGMDISHMLSKRKLKVNSYTIQMTGERPDDVPSPFTKVIAKHVFDVPGLQREMADRLVDLAMNKYCSVGASLNAELSYEVELLHEVGDPRSADEVNA